VLAVVIAVGCRVPFDFGTAGETGLRTPPPERTRRRFQVRLNFEVAPSVEDTGVVAVWVPYPSDDAEQKISNIRWDSKTAFRLTPADPEYGNRFLYARFDAAKGLKLDLSWEVRRRAANYEAGRDVLADEDLEFFLRGTDGESLAALRSVIRSTSRTDMDLVRAAYDAVLARLSYDPDSGHHGDTDAILADGVGNSFDYTDVYAALTRQLKLPTKVKVGYVLPQATSSTWRRLEAVRAWVEVYTDSFGWVPVDPASGDARPERRRFFVGHLDPDRVVFSTGTRVMLSPAQAGPPLEHFALPYVEAEGRALSPTKLSLEFRDF